MMHQVRPETDIKICLYGSEFQLGVWSALLEIPLGQVRSYSFIAHQIHNPLALRAVGTAVGQNPVAPLIPCHRVVRNDGHVGNYAWGESLKKKILNSEGVHC
jgi:AraC family transcriptional regulator of adaptative response/methylated-DNA-[protein]-cysteine methyltransferase